MSFSLRTKLSLSFVLVALLSVFITSIMANFLLEKQFRQYVIKKQDNKNKEIISLITQQYMDKNDWRTEVIQNIGINALESGLIVKVKDASGIVIWDATTHNSGMCEQMLSNMSKNMLSRYPNWQGGYVESKYPIVVNSVEVGLVEIGYYGPFYFNDNDLYFINTLNKALILIGIISLILSLAIGILFSKKLSAPIANVIETAKLIAKGHFSERSIQKSSTSELQELISTINHLAESLDKHEKLRKQLTGDVAHELRTPMATIQGHIEAMIDGIWVPSTERLESLHEEVIRVNTMIGDLHLLAKFESESLILKKEEFKILDLIKSIVMNFEGEYKLNNVSIRYSGGNEIINADRDKLTQVFVNLLSNSLKYTPQDGKVEITVERFEGSVKVSVADNGQGIPEEDVPFIFERFFRADKSRNRLTGGTGIGLAIVKSIIDAHHGSIHVKSKINEGSTFVVIIPKE